MNERTTQPPQYWEDFANVEQELRAFIAQHAVPGVMPSKRKLLAAQRGDLLRAFARHGGIVAVAERLGLARPHARRPPHYWDDLANLAREVEAYIAAHGTPGIMPTYTELERAGYGVLKGVIRAHGGPDVIAAQLGLARPQPAKPAGYWDDFTTLERELHAFIAAHGTPGAMPSYTTLEQEGQHALLNAIRQHGGMAVVAERLGLARFHARKPAGYWDDFANVERELHAFIAAHGTAGQMPTAEVLAAHGHAMLASAIGRHGGPAVVATRMGLARPYAKKPPGYWDDLVNVEREVQAFITVHGTDGVMPTTKELLDAGAGAIVDALQRHGGLAAVATRLGLHSIAPRKLPGYWADFGNLERELRAFIAAHGADGVMPGTRHLRDAQRSDLIHAIKQHGGIEAVAARLGLARPPVAKPTNYWADFGNLERELRAFIIANGAPGDMPSKRELESAQRKDLVHAIEKHGGIAAIAARLNLRRAQTAKPANYWADFANLEHELHAFIAAEGVAGMMPSNQALTAARRRDLVHAITRHGGTIAVAERLGLARSRTAKPPHYWSDFANLERELRAFITAQGAAGLMPTYDTLAAAKRQDLVAAIQRHGGTFAVAERLGLVHPVEKKPAGYWDDFAALERELAAFITAHGSPGHMPTTTELVDAGQHALRSAIQQHGGMLAVAERLGLARPDARKPANYWDDLANVERELRAFIARHGTPGQMPTSDVLYAQGCSTLAAAIGRHGGFAVVAERMGLTRPAARKPLGYWDDFANVERELRAFLATHGRAGRMPTMKELAAAGCGPLASALTRHGGMAAVAERLGLERTDPRKPPGYWADFANLARELRQALAAQGITDRLPPLNQLIALGRQDLAHAIGRHGGPAAVADRLGMIYQAPLTDAPRRAATGMQLAQALQPLADAQLLHSAHVLVLLRRTGLLASRDPRIVQLRAGLARGDQAMITAALAALQADGSDLNRPPRTVNNADKDEEPDRLDEIAVWDELGEEAEEDREDQEDRRHPDRTREQRAVQGLALLDALRLPLDTVLYLLTERVLWEAFYARLYAWYESLAPDQPVHVADVQQVMRPALQDQALTPTVLEVLARFEVGVAEAINLAAALGSRGWRGPRLRLHQADAARRMAAVLSSPDSRPFFLNADDPGMGKSVAFLAAVCSAGSPSILLIAPKMVADDTWTGAHGEIARCLPQAQVLRGMPALLATRPEDRMLFGVVHYEELLDADAVAALAERSFACLCLDETHYIKRRAGQDYTRRRAALDTLRRSARAAIGLTGTPLVNELAEPLSLLQILSQHAPQFAHAQLDQRRMSDAADVFEAMLPHMIRRAKPRMLLHLPGYSIATVPIPLPNDRVEMLISVHAWPKNRASAALIELRKLAVQAKLPYLMERAQQTVKLLILTYLREDVSTTIAAQLMEVLPDQVLHINGATSRAERAAALAAFRRPDGPRVLVGTLGTIGVGLTLFDPELAATANEIIIADLPYTWAAFEQGIARLHREGQQQEVRVDVLQTTTTAHLGDATPLQTIDERIWALIGDKRQLALVAVDGQYTQEQVVLTRRALHRWLDQARTTGIGAIPKGTTDRQPGNPSIVGATPAHVITDDLPRV